MLDMKFGGMNMALGFFLIFLFNFLKYIGLEKYLTV